jgi:hypothetical protein
LGVEFEIDQLHHSIICFEVKRRHQLKFTLSSFFRRELTPGGADMRTI